MKKIVTLLVAAMTLMIIGQASAATINFSGKSLDSLSNPLICDEEKKKKKKKGDEEEPECE